MIKIRKATQADSEVLANLGRITYTESHGHFIEDSNDLNKYIEEAFSLAKTQQDINSQENVFYLMYKNNFPIGYAKLVLHTTHKKVISKNNCKLDRIYILNDFIPLKVGFSFLSFLENEAKEFGVDTMWLSVYNKNLKAIRFYKRNNYKEVGETIFLVNGKDYKNKVLEKAIM